jgi:hypothetical protein
MPIPKWCDPKSIRTVKSGKARVLICCPRKKWKKGRCRVGTKEIEIRKFGEYLVRYTVTHDRPQNRGATFGPVPIGAKAQKEDRVTSRKVAIALYNEIIRGDMDSSADYVSSVQVLMPRKGASMLNVRPFTKRGR